MDEHKQQQEREKQQQHAGRHAVPAMATAADSITATDLPKAEHPAVAAKTPTPDPELLSSSTHHTDNPLSSQVRNMTVRDVLNPNKLRQASEKAHEQEGGHNFPGMTHTR